MFRKIAMTTLIAVLALGLTGCIVRRAEDVENRAESRAVTKFDTVDFSGYGRVEIVQGDTYELELNGPADLLDKVTTEVHGDTLYIGRDAGWEIWLFGMGDRKIDVTITAPTLSKIKVAGAGDVIIDGLEADSFEFELSGAGTLRGEDLRLGDLGIEMSGAGTAALSGRVDDQQIIISGAGEYEGGDLESKRTRVDMSGAGNATVWATESLDIEASGAGSVKYWGDPDLRQDVSGAGTVHGLGDK
ncbi:MAG: head GIN domain-containing protein [Coriobacteriia bacterium]|nr:head GIN domain-containing protein [Coriobacteriia bacterium]MDO9107513.1 head GIN domain-containing protein [Coriobacteriia bacterium]